jgi:hypothetical protein
VTATEDQTTEETTRVKKEKVEGTARLRWIPLGKMKVSERAQREQKSHRVNHLIAHFDLDKLGKFTVSERPDGFFYVIDGQHRLAAMLEKGYTEIDEVQCWVYTGLTEGQEAEEFLGLNDVLTVDSMTKFKVGVEAKRTVETDIDRIVRLQELVVSPQKVNGAISAVDTLRRIYTRSGPKVLRRTLIIVRDSYGNPGLLANVLEGVGLVCHRWGDELDDQRLIKSLSTVHAGVSGILGRAEQLKMSTGARKGHCVAAAVVEVYNRSKGPKLQKWFSGES